MCGRPSVVAAGKRDDLGSTPPARFSNACDRADEAAAAEAGASDFGDGECASLRVLLESMVCYPRFTELGRKRALGLVVDALASRAIASRVSLFGCCQ